MRQSETAADFNVTFSWLTVCPQMYATFLFVYVPVHLIWKRIPQAWEMTTVSPSLLFPYPRPDAINLTVFALLCSFNQPRSISVHAEHILLITFATCTESLHNFPSLLSPPPFWLRVFAQVYEIFVHGNPKKSNRSGCSWTQRTKATFSGIAFLWSLRASV